MKNIIYALCAFAVIILVPAKAQEPDPASFFPTTVGNMTLFENYYPTPYPTFLIELYKDSIDEAGNKYIFFKEPQNEPSPDYYRIDTGLNVYGGPYLLFMLKARVGDFWDIGSGTYRVLSRQYKANICGVLTTIREYDQYAVREPGKSEYDWKGPDVLWSERYALASGFGLVAVWGEPDDHIPQYGIKAAIINGDTLGDFKMPVSVVEEKEPVSNIISCFPNPASDFIQLHLPFSQDSYAVITLYALNGEKIATLYEGELYSNNITLNTGAYSPGLYLIKVNMGMAVYTTKLLISR
jgi:hypothetical protein